MIRANGVHGFKPAGRSESNQLASAVGGVKNVRNELVTRYTADAVATLTGELDTWDE